MQWYEWLHLLILIFLVVWICAVVEEPDYDKDGRYIGIKDRFLNALLRLIRIGD